MELRFIRLLAEPWLSIFNRLLPHRLVTSVEPQGRLRAGLSAEVVLHRITQTLLGILCQVKTKTPYVATMSVDFFRITSDQTACRILMKLGVGVLYKVEK
jgi:hypothetical protein